MTDQYNLPELGAAKDDAPAEPRQKALRDLFVSEYLIDFNEIAAAQRCGFNYQNAREFGTRLLQETYVQRRIRELQYVRVDVDKDTEFNRTRIKNRLIFEAHYIGPGSTQAARVQALNTLAKIYQMEEATSKRADEESNNRGGVLVAPAIANVDDWEATAVASQEALISDARK